jgi:hypothetical protein
MVKRVVHHTLRHSLEALLVVIGIVVVMAAGLALRLSRGPIALPGLRPAVEHLLAKEVEGGRATVGEATLVWFPDTQALGVRLKNVSLVDGRRRLVLRAAAVEGAVALDSTLLFTPSPGRLTASNFFAAVSISPQGKYGLGYDAKGAPERVGGLDKTLAELTGEARRGHPVSYLRDLDLSSGVLNFREVAGPVAWSSRIDRVTFHKANGRIVSDCRLVIDDGQRKSTLEVSARAAVGLKEARLTGVMSDLTPARVFPSVGATRPLSALDALVQGHGTLDYAASRGVTAADVKFTAGAGRLRFGSAFQRFDSAQVAGSYDPATGEVKLDQFKVAAERTRLDLAGKMKLIPEQGKDHPAHLAFELRGPDGLVTLAPSAAPQPVEDLFVRGDYAPERGRLALDDMKVRVAGAPITGHLLLQRGKKEGDSWGLQSSAAVGGSVGPDQIMAFWPEGLGEGARSWLHDSLKAGRVHDVKFTADIPPGAMNGGHGLKDDALRVDFVGEGLEIRILDDLPHLTELVGTGVLRGNSLDIKVSSGKLAQASLTEGVVEIPKFAPKGARAVFKARATGDAGQILQIVDQPKAKLISGHGFDPTRVSGQADVVIEISRPMLSDVPAKDYGVHYVGRVRQAGLRQAAIGLDLHDGDLAVEGSANDLLVKGAGLLGPYHGGVIFKADFTGKTGMTADLDGLFDVAGSVAGAPGGGAPFKAHFAIKDGQGAGVIHSRPFEGRATWTDNRRFVLEGTSQYAGWRQAGVPVSSGVPATMPIRLTLDHTGDNAWSGRLEADAYSGGIVWTGGDVAHLRYTAEITPEEARRLGFGGAAAFQRTQSVSADIALAPAGSANYAIGPMTGRIEWVMNPGSTVWKWKAMLGRGDLAAMGVPGVIAPAAPIPVDATLTAAGGGLSGEVDLAGAAFKVSMAGRTLNIVGAPSDGALERMGLVPDGAANGVAGLAARFDHAPDGHWSGHVEADLTHLALSIPDTDWRKVGGKAARVFADVTARPDGSLSLDRIVAEGPGLDIQAQASIVRGKLGGFSTRVARIDGVFDGAVQITEDNAGFLLRGSGKFIDTRPILHRLSKRADPGPGGDGAAAGRPWRVEAQFGQARVTDVGLLRDVKVSGEAGRLDVAAATANGSTLGLKLFPEAGGTAFTARIGDVAQVAEAFFGPVPLKGGAATATGRLAEDGFDAVVQMENVRVIRAPVMAQLLTMASFKGMGDTLNGDGIVFSRVMAPMRVRGAKVFLDDARATGQAMGITGKGVIDLDERTLDLSGAVAPAYSLNSAIGNVPVLGALLTSRKGEGVVGMTYTARGQLKSPKVSVNPLSLAAPGILRRMFEPVRRPSQGG